MAGSLPALNKFQPPAADHTSGAQAGSRKRNPTPSRDRAARVLPATPGTARYAAARQKQSGNDARRQSASGVWSERKRPLPCTCGIKTAKGAQTPGALPIVSHVLNPRDRGSSGHDQRNGRPSRASPIQMSGSGTPGEEAPMAHNPKMGNGPLNCSHARSLAPAVLQPYVRLVQIRTRGAYREPDQRRAHRQKSPLSPTSTRSRSRPKDRGERGQTNEPCSVRNPQGQRSPTTKILPGPAKNARGRAKKPKRDSRVASWQSRHTCTRRDHKR